MRRTPNAAPELLGAWVDVDNQLARIAPVLAEFGVWLRFMRDSDRPPRLGVVNPATGPAYSVRAEVTAARMDGPDWGFLYHSVPDVLPVPLGTDVIGAAARVAYLLGITPVLDDRATGSGESRGAATRGKRRL